MNFVATGISLTAWSGTIAGVGAAFLFPKMSFIHAAAIGGGSLIASVVALSGTILIAKSISEDFPDKRFLMEWAWVAIIPSIAIPYFAGVSTVTGIGLVALGIVGGVLNVATATYLAD